MYQALQTLVHPKTWLNLQPFLKPKSMKRTPYWMAPEVIRQTGHITGKQIMLPAL
jgi:hypothetical protein